ncbi:MAG: hypothetical protein M3336_15370, partial [Chloroflexota bacterium]|nr:hypothetical protein [Chloroflexota bacterium]
SPLSVASGSDAIGRYQEVAFEQLVIRAYEDEQIVVFRTTYQRSTATPPPFPRLHSYPSVPYTLSYRTLPFAPYEFNNLDNAADSPWLFFDDNANAFMLSPLTDFMVARTSQRADGVLETGIAPVGDTPAGLTHGTMLVAGVGINHVFEVWGKAMLRQYGKQAPANDADLTLERLGYWTDNGASYYYNFEPALGYEGTLLAVKREFEARQVPLGYMQLDSWWYPKGPAARWDARLGGIFRYRPAPELFPDGLAAFRQRLALPLVTHARWIDKDSPLRDEFDWSGNVITDARYWEDAMAYLAAAGVVTYEQDWLGNEAQPVYDLVAPGAFLDNMAIAARRHGLTLQYCVPLPRHVLQTLNYPQVTTIRVSNDRFDPTRWDEFLYDSRLASALGVWPFTDVLMSAERGNLALATLSAGIVGVGDQLGAIDVANLRRVVRADGTIVKPDLPLAPLDATYLAEAAAGPLGPMLASTYSDHDGLRHGYVFGYARGAAVQEASFAAAEAGVSDPAYVYDVFADSGRLLGSGERFSTRVPTEGALYVVAPVGPSGIAMLGDRDMFASLGRKRIPRLQDDGAVRVRVDFAAAENAVLLHGYAPEQPEAWTAGGEELWVDYDVARGRFSARVTRPDQAHEVDVEFRLPVGAVR